MTHILGVDGAPGGWMGALTRTDDVLGADVVWVTFATIAEALLLDVAVVAIDMPIGLPRTGRRACDRLAKRALGKAHPRVFFAPPRDVLAAASYDDAGARHRAHADGHGLSVQTWNIVAKIREVDAVADDPRLVEVHPELSFARLAGAVLTSKHGPDGRTVRPRAGASVAWTARRAHGTRRGRRPGGRLVRRTVAAWSRPVAARGPTTRRPRSPDADPGVKGG